jgi:hypothetical protein
MTSTGIPVLAGIASTTIFAASVLPMVVKARRSRDLRSYSRGNLVLANIGNGVHSVYVFDLPPGPIWALHGFYLVTSALMLVWSVRYASLRGSPHSHGLPRQHLRESRRARSGTGVSGSDQDVGGHQPGLVVAVRRDGVEGVTVHDERIARPTGQFDDPQFHLTDAGAVGHEPPDPLLGGCAPRWLPQLSQPRLLGEHAPELPGMRRLAGVGDVLGDQLVGAGQHERCSQIRSTIASVSSTWMAPGNRTRPVRRNSA